MFRPGPWALLLSACACAPSSLSFTAPLPREINWVGLLFLDRSGSSVGATGLMRYDPSDPPNRLHQIDREAQATVVLVGYRDEDLQGVLRGMEDPELRLLDQPLATATPDDPILPPPYWSGSGPAADGLVVLAEAAAPEVTAPWLPACPLLLPSTYDPAVRFDTSTGVHCAATAIQVDCAIISNLADCLTVPPNELRLNGRGTLDPRALGGHCRPAAPKSGARLAMICDTFPEERTDLYAPPIPDRFEVERMVAWPVAEPQARLGLVATPLLGYLPALTRVTGCPEERLVVVRRSNPRQQCSPGVYSLAMIDPVTMTITATAAAPCLDHLAEDPAGGGFYGVSGPPLLVTRFDCDGRPGPAYSPPSVLVAELLPTAVTLAQKSAADPPSDLVIATYRCSNGPGELWIFDTRTRQFRPPLEIFAGGRSYSVTTLGPNSLVVGVDSTDDGDGERLHFTDYTSDTPRWAQVHPSGSTLEQTAYFLAASQERVVAGSGATNSDVLPGVRVAQIGLSGPEFVATLTDWKIYGSMSTSLVWPGTPHLLIPTTEEGAIGGPPVPPRTVIGLFDVSDPHFLPGQAELGYGPVSATVVDGRGAVWMALTWSGELARVRARSLQ